MDLVTGGSGFIGSRLVVALKGSGRTVRVLSRGSEFGADVLIGDLNDLNSLRRALDGVSCVFHCGGFAHAFSSLGQSDAAIHWQVNFEGTQNLVEAAAQAGVKRFVFLSSVKAMAEPGLVCADEDFPGSPETDYGRAKRAAEQAVLETGKHCGMHVVNLRLAMVYGAGGRGNLERMGRLVQRGIFPPLPETGNHRSLVHLDDVVAVMRLVADDERAAGRTYIVAGPEAPSGRQLYDALRQALRMAPRAWEIPASVFRVGARVGDGLEALTRRRMPLNSEVLERLLGSAWYSPARIERELCWRARVSLAEGLREMFGT